MQQCGPEQVPRHRPSAVDLRHDDTQPTPQLHQLRVKNLQINVSANQSIQLRTSQNVDSLCALCNRIDNRAQFFSGDALSA